MNLDEENSLRNGAPNYTKKARTQIGPSNIVSFSGTAFMHSCASRQQSIVFRGFIFAVSLGLRKEYALLYPELQYCPVLHHFSADLFVLSSKTRNSSPR
jgi:hypothetical protein